MIGREGNRPPMDEDMESKVGADQTHKDIKSPIPEEDKAKYLKTPLDTLLEQDVTSPPADTSGIQVDETAMPEMITSIGGESQGEETEQEKEAA